MKKKECDSESMLGMTGRFQTEAPIPKRKRENKRYQLKRMIPGRFIHEKHQILPPCFGLMPLQC
jgi:hypothetical protein